MRFPLFGGWQTQWYQGFNVPLAQAVALRDDGSYALTVGFGPTLQNVVVDALEVKVVLPEGATNIQVSAPVQVSRSDSKRVTYLDTPWSGRTVVSLKTTNFVGAADGELTVTYNMPPMAMIREPIMLIVAFFTLFASYAILSRINLSLK